MRLFDVIKLFADVSESPAVPWAGQVSSHIKSHCACLEDKGSVPSNTASAALWGLWLIPKVSAWTSTTDCQC